MAPFLSTFAKQRIGGTIPARRALLPVTLLCASISLLRAGTLITLANGSAIDGKLSIAAAGIHTVSASPVMDTALSDVLEAKFTDDPFPLDVFFVCKGDQLPPNWNVYNIGHVGVPGTVTVRDGTFTLNGSGTPPKPKAANTSDDLFFVGQPWLGNGVLTARLMELDAQNPQMIAGLMLRDTLVPASAMCAAGPNSKGGMLQLAFRRDAGKAITGGSAQGGIPLWLRFTRRDNEVFTSVSSNGNDWDIVEESPFQSLARPVVGLFVNSRNAKSTAKAVFDQISVSPLPSSAQIIPPGVVLQGGSLLAGHFEHLNFDPADADNNGLFLHGGRRLPISRSLVAAVIMLPMERSRLEKLGARPSVLMKNGDFMDGNASTISNGQISVNSVLLGITDYSGTEISACIVDSLRSQPTAYEVRLKDGSIINATAISADASQVVLTDASGLTIRADPSELAQIRAGASIVQTLAQLDWIATPLAAPVLAANTAQTPAPPLVQSWLGKNQDQILETGVGTAIEFPLVGKFRAMGVQVALTSDSPPHSTTTIYILADGHEIAKFPHFRAGDPPQFIEVTLHNPSHVTLQTKSPFTGVKVLYIDPVAIRN